MHLLHYEAASNLLLLQANSRLGRRCHLQRNQQAGALVWPPLNKSAQHSSTTYTATHLAVPTSPAFVVVVTAPPVYILYPQKVYIITQITWGSWQLPYREDYERHRVAAACGPVEVVQPQGDEAQLRLLGRKLEEWLTINTLVRLIPLHATAMILPGKDLQTVLTARRVWRFKQEVGGSSPSGY